MYAERRREWTTVKISSGTERTTLVKHLYFAVAAIVSSFVLAWWTLFSYYETNNWERFFFVIGGGTVGFLWLTTIAFRGGRQPRFARAAVIVLPAAALKVIGHYAWVRYLDSRYYWADSMLENSLRLGLGYWLTGAIIIYGVLALVYRSEKMPAATSW